MAFRETAGCFPASVMQVKAVIFSAWPARKKREIYLLTTDKH
jgi:hypothetical protein